MKNYIVHTEFLELKVENVDEFIVDSNGLKFIRNQEIIAWFTSFCFLLLIDDDKEND